MTFYPNNQETAGALAWRARRLSLTTVDKAFDQYWSSRLAGLSFLRRLWLYLFESRSRQAWVAGLSMRYDLNELLLEACRRYAYENSALNRELGDTRAQLGIYAKSNAAYQAAESRGKSSRGGRPGATK